MPIPEKHIGESKNKFMGECIKFLMNEGTPHDQAIAMCMSKVNNQLDEDLEPTEFNDELKINEGIFEGFYTVKNLPQELFNFQYLNIMGGVGWGYGLPTDFNENTFKFEKADKFKRNIEFFSGAKTKDEVNKLNDLVFKNGKKRPFKEFLEEAQSINTNYNKTWLKTELNTAFLVAESAEKWEIIQEEKEIFPLLQYQTVGDDRVRPEHRQWDNIIRAVNDPFWDTRYPPNGFLCRCKVIQLRDGNITPLTGVPQNSDKYFNNNPGKSNVIFKKSGCPYGSFDKDKTNLKTPSDNDVKKIMAKIWQ